jgi:WD40 repeat protein
VAVLRGHEGSLFFAAFSPDGRADRHRLLGPHRAGVAAPRAGRAEAVLVDHAKVVRSAEFSGDGLRVVTASDDGTAKIWRSDGAGDVVTLLRPRGPGAARLVQPRRTASVVTASQRPHRARVWAADFDNPALLRTKIRATTTACLVAGAAASPCSARPLPDAETRHRDCETKAGR